MIMALRGGNLLALVGEWFWPLTLDSRYFGFVPNEDVLGKLLYVYWSKDFERIGKDVK